MALLAGAFLLTLQQAWGKKDADHHPPATDTYSTRVSARRIWSPDDLWRWLLDTQTRNARAKRSHAKRRLAQLRQPSL